MTKKSILHKKIPALSIIELSITLVIMGIVSIGCMALFKTITIRGQYKINEYRHMIITQALCRFASQHGYLPAPITPITSPANYNDFHALTGSIPHQLLGLSKNTVKNITYTVDNRFTNPQLKPISYKQFESTNITDDAICFIKNFTVNPSPTPDKLDQLMISNNNAAIYTYGQTLQTYQIVGQLYYHQQSTIIDHGMKAHAGTITTQIDPSQKTSYNIIQGRPKIENLALVYDCIVFVLTTPKKSHPSELYIHTTSPIIKTEQYQHVSYITRFNLELHGGPKCRPFIKNKQNLATIKDQSPSSSVPYITDTKGIHHIATNFIDITSIRSAESSSVHK